MKKKISYTLMLFFYLCNVFLFSFCENKIKITSVKLEIALQKSGVNRRELEGVLLHYKNDSLKYKAACFLIENMIGHFSYEGQSIDMYKKMLEASPKPLRPDSMDLFWKNSEINDDDIQIVYDAETITKSFLIENIDKAFMVWRSSSWHSEINFDIFCRYILPYRIFNENLTSHWRDSLELKYSRYIKGVKSVQKAFAIISNKVNKNLISSSPKSPYTLDVLTIEKVRLANCEQRCVVRGSVMRALGIPVAFDYIRNWANYSTKGHSWISLVLSNNATYTLCDEDSIPKKNNNIDASFFKPLVIPRHNYPYLLDSLKRVSKIYRREYFISDSLTPFNVDVSDQYGLKDSIVINVRGLDGNYVYLCNFKTGDGWMPLIKSKVYGNRCVFRDLGVHIVYLPVIIERGKITPIDVPYILHKGGVIQKIIPSKKSHNLILNRKYILLTNWTNRWYEMIGGRFEASNDSNFNKVHLLHVIEYLPIYKNIINLHCSKSYRYVRYVSPGISKSALAELSFFENNIELAGDPIGVGLSYPAQKRVFDHDLMTIGDPREVNYWVGLDLGRRCYISKLNYYPRNDDNFIIAGDLYELFYYNKGSWCSLGMKKAEWENLVFKNVPKDALYLLKNKIKGKEERIFTYSNGKQVWW